jgi:hypothetical protein
MPLLPIAPYIPELPLVIGLRIAPIPGMLPLAIAMPPP